MLLVKSVEMVVVPTVVVVSLVEAWVLSRKRRGSFDWSETRISLLDLLGRALFPFSLTVPLLALAWQHRLQTIPMNGPLALLLLFLVEEFSFYWYHRVEHRVRFFWATHAVHHSPNQLTMSTSCRQGWTAKINGATLFLAPMVWLGFRPELAVVALVLNLFYQLWVHTTLIPRLGWCEWVFNTPSAHRVHHASNLEYLDANYGGVLIVFDRLFGTYVAEQDAIPCRYGLVTPMRSRNPLVVEFQHWIELGRDMRQAGSLWASLGYLWHPPGWRPDGPGTTTEELRRQVQNGAGQNDTTSEVAAG